MWFRVKIDIKIMSSWHKYWDCNKNNNKYVYRLLNSKVRIKDWMNYKWWENLSAILNLVILEATIKYQTKINENYLVSN